MKNAKIDPAWTVCLKTIRATGNGEHLQASLDTALKSSAILQKNLCTDWVYAYFRFKCRAAYILKKFLAKPDKLPPDMIVILKLALAAIFSQDGRPEYAIVSGAAGHVKKMFGSLLAGIANGVLRNILKHREDLDKLDWYREENDEPIAPFARFYGMPLSIAALWQNSYGEEAAIALLRRSAARPWQGVRFNPWHENGPQLRDWFFSRSNAGLCKIGSWGAAIAPDFPEREIMGKSLWQWRQEGALDFQAAGSQLVLEKLEADAWEGPFWDACAGVGGKTLALQSRKRDAGLVTDTSMKRLGFFARRWPEQLRQKPAFALMDAARPAILSWGGHILADVPCSGLGVLARRPELRKSAGDLQSRLHYFQKNQLEILRALTGLLQPGKRLAYITCTLNPAENEKNIKKILAEKPYLRLVKTWQTPHDHPWLEGMFGAALAKEPVA